MKTKPVKPFIITIFLQMMIFIPIAALGQLSKNVLICNVDLVYKDDKVSIPYTINGQTTDNFVVWIELFNSKNERIDAKSISGDVNQVKGSGGKQINWDIKADGVTLNDNIYAKVSAKKMVTASAKKAFLQSTIYPGWGDYQFKADKPHWIKGALGYGLVGASTAMYLKSNQSFNKYKSSGLPSSQDPSYSSAMKERQTSLIFAGAAVVVWAWDYIGLFSKTSKYKKKSVETIKMDNGYRLYSDVSPTRAINTFTPLPTNKLKTNIANIININSITPSAIKRPNSVGVIFGISSYKELPSAPYADKDARIIKDYFEKVLGVEQVIAYTNEQVNGFIFDDVFNPDNGELQRAIVQGETEVFVFYSGHGIPDKSGENVYLFPSDGKITRLETQGYNIEKLYTNLSKMGAKHVTVILDACFSGGSRKTEKIKTENLIAQKGVKVRPRNTWLMDKNFTIISSSTGEETSLGFDTSETGLFTYYLCAGLQGKADENNDKTITLGELKAYVIKNVTETSKKISGLQTPLFTGDDSLVITKY